MTTMLAIIGTVAIITVQVIEYNMTEIHIPTAEHLMTMMQNPTFFCNPCIYSHYTYHSLT